MNRKLSAAAKFPFGSFEWPYTIFIASKLSIESRLSSLREWFIRYFDAFKYACNIYLKISSATSYGQLYLLAFPVNIHISHDANLQFENNILAHPMNRKYDEGGKKESKLSNTGRTSVHYYYFIMICSYEILAMRSTISYFFSILPSTLQFSTKAKFWQ